MHWKQQTPRSDDERILSISTPSLSNAKKLDNCLFIVRCTVTQTTHTLKYHRWGWDWDFVYFIWNVFLLFEMQVTTLRRTASSVIRHYLCISALGVAILSCNYYIVYIYGWVAGYIYQLDLKQARENEIKLFLFSTKKSQQKEKIKVVLLPWLKIREFLFN